MTKPKYIGWTVNISRSGDVTLRRPSGRTVGWYGGTRPDPLPHALEWLAIYRGATLVDNRPESSLR